MENQKNRNYIFLAALFLIVGFLLGSISTAGADSSKASIFDGFLKLFGAGKVRTAGDVSVVSDETAADATIILGNTRSTLGAFSFSAANDTMIVKKMQILISPFSNPNNPNGGAADEVPRIYLYDGDTLIGSPGGYKVTVSGNNAGIAFISGLNWVLPKDSSRNLIVKGDVDRIGFNEQWADSGASVYSHIMSSGFEACTTSRASGCDTEIFPASSAQRLVYKSKPILEKIPYNGLLGAGNKIPAFRFKVSADPMGEIEWSKVQFYISMIGATMSAANSQTTELWDITNGSSVYLWDMYSAPSVSSSQKFPIPGGYSGYVTLLLNTPQRITAGSSKDYELRLGFRDLVQAPGAVAVIRLSRSETAVKNAMSQWGIEAPTYDGIPSLIWSDYSAVAHSTSTLDWANGLYVRTFEDANLIHN